MRLDLREQAASSAEMSMGFRVGEVTQTSAIVWTRVSREKQRVWNGHREPMKRSRKQDKYTPSTIKVQDREGEAPGQVGQVRVTCSRDKDFTDTQPTEWVTVKKENDYVHQFRLSGLQAGTKHFLKVEARDTTNDAVSAVATGSFGTPAFASDWQDVRFFSCNRTVVLGPGSQRRLPHVSAMRKLNLDFIVPTGDTVYLDSEAPRARTVALARYHWHRMYSLPRHIKFHSLVPGYWEVDDHDSWCNDCWPTMQAAWMNPLTFRRGFEIYREQVPMGDVTYRTIRWGQGLQIWMVEGRLYRSSNRLKTAPKSQFGAVNRWLG